MNATLSPVWTLVSNKEVRLAAIAATMGALRRERDGLLLKDRRTKNTKTWRARYRRLTNELNALATESRIIRWAK